MSQTEPGVIQRYADAWRSGDLTTMFDLYDKAVLVHYGGTSPFAGTHLGKDRLIEVLIATAARSDRKLISVDAVFDNGDSGAIFVTESFRLDAATVTVPRALRYRVENDHIVECWLFDFDQHLVDRAWEQQPPE
jgi:uncharacterized protein